MLRAQDSGHKQRRTRCIVSGGGHTGDCMRHTEHSGAVLNAGNTGSNASI